MTGDIRYFVFLPRDVKIEQLFAAAEQNYTSHAKINAIYKIDYKVLLAKKLVPYRSRPRKKKKKDRPEANYGFGGSETESCKIVMVHGCTSSDNTSTSL